MTEAIGAVILSAAKNLTNSHHFVKLPEAIAAVILSAAKNLTLKADTECDVRFFAALRMTAKEVS